ncbi:hypothetical protein ACUDTL_16865 [Stenotrophomonas pavanii]|uniref:hypothetical protein n=1 Tax=Stenotrophomonas pavanii TaxID=487698 RepID=UPI004042729C
MALPGSGAISWEMIRAEFGGGYPIYANQYYRGAGLVPNVPANYGVPTSGMISASHFYNAVKAIPFSASLSPSWVGGTWPNSTNGSLSAGVTVQCSGGTGNYSVISRSIDGGGTISGSGLGNTVSASGRNTTKSGTFAIVVSDGVNSITLYGSYEFSFGVPV